VAKADAAGRHGRNPVNRQLVALALAVLVLAGQPAAASMPVATEGGSTTPPAAEVLTLALGDRPTARDAAVMGVNAEGLLYV
jgi:hypothetical protein